MERVMDSIDNGQRKQALSQMEEDGIEFLDLLKELNGRGMHEEVVVMVSIAESVSYISYNPANL